MDAPGLEQIVSSVLRWQHRHPLAQRLDAQAVHSIGLVALPFLRAAPRAPGGWRSRLQRLPAPLRPALPPALAFSERFIDEISPQMAARFAERHGVESVVAAEDWPQRRIAVDADRSAAAEGSGWPYERWLASAALDTRGGERRRVLIGLQPNARGELPVLGRRSADLRRWGAAAAVLLALLAGAAWLGQGEPEAPAPSVRVAGAVVGASAPAASQAASATQPMAASMPASAPASSPGATAASAPASSPAAAAAALPTDAEPPIDIRPRLAPLASRAPNRPPLLRGAPPAPEAASQPAAPEQPATPRAPAETSAEAPRGDVGAANPERLRPRWAPPGQRSVALVSVPHAKKADAEALLQRMREHVAKVVQDGAGLEGEVFESPQGYRAAVYPFGSREEAQIVNATLIARGIRSRAVDF
jgi:hypothetical protein